jgi:D-threo-aldose 1-dehydrogenase
VPAHDSERPRIGRRGIRVSALGFGSAPLGNLYSAVADADAQASVHKALAGGVRYFDTAPFYGHGLSETRLGRALVGTPRSSYVVSTKVGRRIAPDESASRALNDGFAVGGSRAVFDYSGDGVRRCFEESLQRLRLDHVDILLLHDIGRLTHPDQHDQIMKQALDEALPAMMALRDSGAVGAIGIGVNEQAACLEVLAHFELDCIMLAGRYTLFEQKDSVEIMTHAAAHRLAILVAAPYNSGLLAGAAGPGTTYNYAPADAATLERARNIYAQCALEGIPVGAAALQFPLAHPAVAAVVAGLRTPDEVESAVSRMTAVIPNRLWGRLKSAGLLAASATVPGA